MKRKKLLNTFLIAMLAMSMIAILGPLIVSAGVSPYSPADKISILNSPPPYETDVECQYNETEFTVEVYVHNITDCAGYQVYVNYNDTLLEPVPYMTVPYTVPKIDTDPANPMTETQIAPLPDQRIDTDFSVVGTVKFSVVWKLGVATYNGSGVAAEITFKIIFCPEQIVAEPQQNNTVSCDLAFDRDWTYATDTNGDDIYFADFNDGYYEYTTIGKVPGAPVPDFTYTPTVVYVSDTVICTDKSEPNGGQIIARKWELAGPATNLTDMHSSTMEFHCDDVGTVNVTLTVWDDEDLSATITKQIEQKERIGCILDLYSSENRFCGQTTPNVGTGPNAPCDALSPDVNVTLFADVSWNGKPVMHVLVAFEVYWYAYPDGTPVDPPECVLFRTAETDKDGTARTWFRVPTPCDAMMFGKWYAYASAKIQEVKQEDRMDFDVGYVITLLSVITEKEVEGVYKPWNEFYAPCDWITPLISLKNIMWIDKVVTLVVVVYDDCDVPIGQIVKTVTVTGGEWCNPYERDIEILDAIHVPQHTYVGTGKIYVSAFTDLPHNCGIPYCPEVSHEFALVWPPP